MGTLERQTDLVNSFADERFFQLMFRSVRECAFPRLSAARAQSLLHVRCVDVSFLSTMLGNAWAAGGRMICWPLSVLVRTSRRRGEASIMEA